MIAESRAPWGRLVLLGKQVYQDLRGRRGHKDPVDAPSLDPRVLRVRGGRKVRLDSKDRREFLVEPELKGGKDLQDPEDSQAKTDPQADKDLQELLGLQEPQEPLEQQDLQENKENWDHRVFLDPRGRKVKGVTSSQQRRFKPSLGRSVSS